MDDSMIVIRNVYTGREYAFAKNRYADLPCVAIENGKMVTTTLHRGDLKSMLDYGSAIKVGTATLAISVQYTETSGSNNQ